MSRMWDSSDFLLTVPCYFLPSLLGHSFLQARKPEEPIFVSSRRSFQKEDKMRTFLRPHEESVLILIEDKLEAKKKLNNVPNSQNLKTSHQEYTTISAHHKGFIERVISVMFPLVCLWVVFPISPTLYPRHCPLAFSKESGFPTCPSECPA